MKKLNKIYKKFGIKTTYEKVLGTLSILGVAYFIIRLILGL